MNIDRPERVKLLSGPYAESFLLYVFEHRGKQRAVWLHKISADAEFIRGPGYTWKCSCGANEAGHGRPLTTELLWEAWSHFDGISIRKQCHSTGRWRVGIGAAPSLTWSRPSSWRSRGSSGTNRNCP